MSITCTCMCIVQQDTVYLKTDRYLTATQQSLWPFQVISRSLWTRIQAKLGRGIGSEGQMIEERNDGCWRHALFDSCKPLLVWSVALVFLHLASLSTFYHATMLSNACLKSMKLMKSFSLLLFGYLSHYEEFTNCASCLKPECFSPTGFSTYCFIMFCINNYFVKALVKCCER